MNHSDQAGVDHARADPNLNRFQIFVGGNDGRQLGIITMVEDLVELFLSPGRVALRAKVVENEQRRIAHLFEALVVAARGVGAVRGAQMIQQIGDVDEQDGLPGFQALVSDGSGEMGLSAPVASLEQQPPLWLGGKVARNVVGHFQIAAARSIETMAVGNKVIEGAGLERAKLADLVKILLAPGF